MRKNYEVQGSHRDVTTKLIKEAKELLSTPPLSPKAKSSLHVISKQLNLKSICLNNLDSEALNLCEVNNTTGEVEEVDEHNC